MCSVQMKPFSHYCSIFVLCIVLYHFTCNCCSSYYTLYACALHLLAQLNSLCRLHTVFKVGRMIFACWNINAKKFQFTSSAKRSLCWILYAIHSLHRIFRYGKKHETKFNEKKSIKLYSIHALHTAQVGCVCTHRPQRHTGICTPLSKQSRKIKNVAITLEDQKRRYFQICDAWTVRRWIYSRDYLCDENFR